MRKCEVLVDRVSLIVSKGSVVFVDDKQFELAKPFLKPCDLVVEQQPLEVKEIETREEKPQELVKKVEVRTKKSKKK